MAGFTTTLGGAGNLLSGRRLWWAIGGVVVLAASVGLWAFGSKNAPPPPRPETRFYVEVKRVLSGHTAKLEPEGRLKYAGIRAPYGNEPLYERAKVRNAQLVDGKKLRVRYDDQERDEEGRQIAYVFDGQDFINETLVREGLAYVRVTANGDRYAERLLAAQAEARRKKRGIWAIDPGAPEEHYPADPKYGNFHRPSCEETSKINPARLVDFMDRGAALDRGLAPCSKCRP